MSLAWLAGCWISWTGCCPQPFKASSFPSPTYILHSQGLKVYLCFFSLCLCQRHPRVSLGAQHLLYLCHKGIYKSREGLEVITVLRPSVCCAKPWCTPAACIAGWCQQTLAGGWAHATTHMRRQMREDLWLLLFIAFLIQVRAAWALGSFHHMVLLPSLRGQEVLPCHVKHMNSTALAICRTWKSALLQQSAAKVPKPSVFLPSASQCLPLHNVICKE